MTKIGVYYNTEPIAEVQSDWCDRLKINAIESDKKRARLCLHHTAGDPLHEMIVVFHKDAVIAPHRHHGKSESFHVIFGELDVLLFDEEGRPSRVVSMGDPASGKSFVYRLSVPTWHSVIVRSEFAGIHEVTDGPFRLEDSDFAPWAPAGDAELRSFLAAALRDAPAGPLTPGEGFRPVG
jgi:cupin fold WbuC family metalloprotein